MQLYALKIQLPGTKSVFLKSSLSLSKTEVLGEAFKTVSMQYATELKRQIENSGYGCSIEPLGEVSNPLYLVARDANRNACVMLCDNSDRGITTQDPNYYKLFFSYSEAEDVRKGFGDRYEVVLWNSNETISLFKYRALASWSEKWICETGTFDVLDVNKAQVFPSRCQAVEAAIDLYGSASGINIIRLSNQEAYIS